MTAAIVSLAALLVVIIFSLTSRVNIGALAVALAWPIGMYLGGLSLNELLSTFPTGLFLTLVGVTLLFGIAQKNGTLEVLARRMVNLCGGVTALLPVAFFLFAGTLSAVGPGATAASALVAPLAMSTGLSARIPAFLTALVVANGANAGNLSPISSVGLIVKAQMERAGLEGHDLPVFLANFAAHAMVAAGAYVLFGGLKLVRAGRVAPVDATPVPPLRRRHALTIGVIVVWIAGVIGLNANPGLSAFVAAAVLIIAGAADDNAAVGSVPWPVILMVSGVSVLIGVLEKTGGMELFTTLLSSVTTPSLVNGTMAFVTGLISTYSSTSAVVYPAFLPTVPLLVQQLGGGNPLEIALSINVGAALVDVSPLSTIGAVCIAALPAGTEDYKTLFRRMLMWGFAMTAVGAVFCQLFIGAFAW